MEYSLLNALHKSSPCETSYSRIDISDVCRSTKINNLSVEERHALIRQYGYQSSSYFSLQKGVDHIGIANVGFISLSLKGCGNGP